MGGIFKKVSSVRVGARCWDLFDEFEGAKNGDGIIKPPGLVYSDMAEFSKPTRYSSSSHDSKRHHKNTETSERTANADVAAVEKKDACCLLYRNDSALK
jgi:hypothetical protein